MHPSNSPETGATATIRRAGRGLQGHLAGLLVAWTLLAAGCGPGVGGTGTGGAAPNLADFGASASAVCSGPLATLLACAAPGTAAADAGTALVQLADASPSAQVLMRLEGNQVELNAPCAGLRFVGTWGQAGSAAPRFFGTVSTAGGGAVSATLDSNPSGAGLQIVLRELGGRTLLGPALLLPAPAAQAVVCS